MFTGLPYRFKGCYLLFAQHFVLEKLIIAQLVKKFPRNSLQNLSEGGMGKPNS
jgi:hypothetical protein